MKDLPDFDTIVHYIKTGLRRKTPLDKIKAVLSKNNLAMTTINKAVVVAIEELEEERKEREEEKPKEVTIHKQSYEQKEPSESKHRVVIAIIFVIFVVGSVILGGAYISRIQNGGEANINSDLATIGAAFRSLFLNKEYMGYCNSELDVPALSDLEKFNICSIGAKHFDDYEVFRNSESKEAITKVLTRVSNDCETLAEELKEICNEKNPQLMGELYKEKTKSKKTLLDSMEHD